MRTIIAKSILFILNKWNTSMDEFKPIGKYLFYIPMYLNNILTQIFYFALFPFVMLYVWYKDKVEFAYKMIEFLNFIRYYNS